MPVPHHSVFTGWMPFLPPMLSCKNVTTRRWADAQRDGRPAKYRWRPLSNAAVWPAPTAGVPCSNAAKMRNSLKLAGAPQTTGPISAASGPKFSILWGHLEEILLLNKFFPIVDTCLSCKDMPRQSCAMVPRWRFFGEFLWPEFSASRVQHVTDPHLNFALRRHHVWKCGRHPICDGWD